MSDDLSDDTALRPTRGVSGSTHPYALTAAVRPTIALVRACVRLRVASVLALALLTRSRK